MIWIGIIFGLLELLLTWLKKTSSLSAVQVRKLNGVIFRARQLEATAVPLGCKAGGEDYPGTMQSQDDEGPSETIWGRVDSLSADPESMRAAIINGIDGALGHTFLITGDNRRLLQGMRAYWAQAEGIQLYKLITLLPQGEKPMKAEELKATVQTADSSALSALVDSFFAGLEARTTNQLVVGLLKGANTLIDLVMTKYGLALLLCLWLSGGVSAQDLPRSRDAVEFASLPRSRDYVEVAKVEAPCKNCDCGCAEGQPCKCDKPGAAELRHVAQCDGANCNTLRNVTDELQHAEPTAPAESNVRTPASAGTEEAGVYSSVPTAWYRVVEPRYRYQPRQLEYLSGRACRS